MKQLFGVSSRRWLFNSLSRKRYRFLLILSVLATLFLLLRHDNVRFIEFSTSSQADLIVTTIDQSDSPVDPEHPFRTEKFKKEFDSIIDKHCDSRDNKLGLSCIQQIHKLDKSIEEKRNKSRQRFHECSDCIYKKLGSGKYEKVFFYHHTFWQIGDDSNAFNKRALRLQIMSFLATQNLCCTRLIVWKLSSFGPQLEKELRREFKYYIEKKSLVIKLFDFEELCAFDDDKSGFYSMFANHVVCKTKPALERESALVALSDFVRFFVLDIYGGIYTDGDVIYLKDTRILWNHNIIYKWSYTAYYNTAVLGFNKYQVAKTKDMLNRFVQTTNSLHDLISAFHPFALAARLPPMENTNVFDLKLVKMYHSSLFDPAWLCNDGVIDRATPLTPCGFRDFNNNLDVERKDFQPDNFFPGAFTYHLHLKDCKTLIKNNSYFQYFEDYFKSVLILDKSNN